MPSLLSTPEPTAMTRRRHRSTAAAGWRSARSRSAFPMMVRWSVLCSGAVLLVLALSLWALVDQRAAVAGMVGGAVAITAFLVGMLGVRVVLAGDPAMSLAGALSVYSIQLLGLMVLALWLRDQAWLDGTTAGISLLVTAVAFQVGQVVGFVRARMPAIVPGPQDGAG